MAHALDLVGERWSLLIVRELLEDDQLRYSDLHARLNGCGTNILAARLKALEHGGVVRRRRLDPPAASWVYELTEYGKGLREVLHVLAHWGARSLGPPASLEDLEPGWLAGALRIALPAASSARASSSESATRSQRSPTTGFVDGAAESPDAVVIGRCARLLLPARRARPRRGLDRRATSTQCARCSPCSRCSGRVAGRGFGLTRAEIVEPAAPPADPDPDAPGGGVRRI